jgi:hypothetical protein
MGLSAVAGHIWAHHCSSGAPTWVVGLEASILAEANRRHRLNSGRRALVFPEGVSERVESLCGLRTRPETHLSGEVLCQRS